VSPSRYPRRRPALGRIAVLAFALAAPAADPGLGRLLEQVENRYNRARTLQVDFEQSYSTPARGRRTEAGELSLRKPGKMRWNYTRPAGKLFVSDGRDAYFYSPHTNRAEKMKLKESEDLRAPLAFLLGRLDFRRDFGEFRARAEGEGTWITAIPRSDRLPYRQVEFLVTRALEIRQLKIAGQDNSVLEFRFDRERVNPPLSDALFVFRAPAGAEVVEEAER
jgi:outer membrane lipoprotein carrier protein